MEKYRKIENTEEILNLIKDLKDQQIGIVWQTLANGEKNVYTILSIETQPDGLMYKADKPITIYNEFPVFFKINNRNLVFKLEFRDLTIAKNLMYCRFPDSALAKDLRREERIKIPVKSIINIHIQALDENPAMIFDTRIMDISEDGIRIKTHPLYEKHFRAVQWFKVKKICDTKLIGTILLQVKFISCKDDQLEVGFFAQGGFSEEFIKIFENHMSFIVKN